MQQAPSQPPNNYPKLQRISCNGFNIQLKLTTFKHACYKPLKTMQGAVDKRVPHRRSCGVPNAPYPPGLYPWQFVVGEVVEPGI